MTVKNEQDQTGTGLTRRGFIGFAAALCTAVIAKSAAFASVAKRTFRQLIPAPLSTLGASWTGPGGVGDYAGKNGNTADVVNAAHAHIRNGDLEQRIAQAPLVDPVYDLVVVGAGIAGLAAAYTFRRERPDSKILILDQHAIFGGEAKQNQFEVDGYPLFAPQGSTGIVLPFAMAEEMGLGVPYLEEIGYLKDKDFVFQDPKNLKTALKIPTDIWGPMHAQQKRADTAYFFEGKGMVLNPWKDGFKEAPLPEHVKKALLQLDGYLTPPKRPDWQQWLDSMSYKDFLLKIVGIPDDAIDGVLQYLDPVIAAMGCGQGAAHISAMSAYNFLAPGVIGYMLYESTTDPREVVTLAAFPGGNTMTARRFMKLLIPDAFEGDDSLWDALHGKIRWNHLDAEGAKTRLRLSSTVLCVAHEGVPGDAKAVRVTYDKGGKLAAVRAKAVVCAGQQHANKRICRDISDEYRSAMESFQHAPMLVINVALRNWHFLEKLGASCVRWFEGIGWWTGIRRNMIIEGREPVPLDPSKPIVMTQYIPFLRPAGQLKDECTFARMEMFSMPYEDIEARVRSQFNKMFGPYGFDDKRDIAAIVTNRQGHAYFVAPPGFYFGKDGKKPAKDLLQEPFHRIAFGHSELSGTQMWETAVLQGQRAAKQMLAVTS